MTAADIAARLDRLPITRFHRRVLYGLSFAFFFELADLNTFAYAAPGLRKYLGLSVESIAVITAASFLGMFLGSIVGGRFADRVGRKRALVWSVVWFSVFSLLNAAAWNATTLFIARLLTGAGLAAMTVVAITYLSELMPRAHRGRMQGAVLAIGLIGTPIMASLARGVVPLGPNGWRIVFLFGAIGVLGLLIILRLPESPRWLLDQNRPEEAETCLAGVEREVAATTGKLPEPDTRPPEVVEERDPRRMFQRPLAGRTWMLFFAWIFQTLGFYGFVSWVPTLLAAHGLGLAQSLTFSALTTIGAVPGALLAWPISDRFRRRTPIVIVSLLIAVCGVAYGLSFNAVAIVVFGFLVSFFIQTIAALLYAYTPELYPTSMRNTGSGFAYGVGRLANMFGPLIVAAIYGSAGYLSVFVYIAACWVVVAVTVGFFGPRTGDVALETIQTGKPQSPAQTVPEHTPDQA
jgi:putative MFS transporter